MIYNLLYDWQKQIVDTLAKKLSFGLWLDCGLGKTVQALALAEQNQSTKVLIVTPNCKATESVNTPGSWQQWATKLGPEWVVRSKGDKHPVTAADIRTSVSAAPDKRDTSDSPDQDSPSVNNTTVATVKNADGVIDTEDNSSRSSSSLRKNGVETTVNLCISTEDLPPSANSARTKTGSSKLPKPFDSFPEYEKTVCIMNYESLFIRGAQGSRVVLKPEVLSFIQSCRHQPVTLLLDESHYIKDPTSTQATALMSIKRELMCHSSVLRTYLLTGTPFTRGFIDVWNQLKFLGCPITKTQFKDWFCVLGNIRGLLGWQQPIVGYKNVDKLYGLIHRYAITLKSDDVLKLPEQVFTEHVHQPSPWFTVLTKKTLPFKTLLNINAVRAELGLGTVDEGYIKRLITVWESEHGHLVGEMTIADAMRQNISVQNPWYRNIDYPESNYLCDTAGSFWMRARQMSIGFQGNAETATWYDETRIDMVVDLLRNREDNYVVFYNYVPEFTELFERILALGYNIDVYNGDIKSLDNYTRYAGETPEARLTDKKNVILTNFASGSTGMNWQEYNQCVIVSLPCYKHWAQGLKRVHRNGSKDTVFYHVFKSSNWLDTGMWQTLRDGVEYSEDMFNKALNEAQV
jgi:hypothetical protein